MNSNKSISKNTPKKSIKQKVFDFFKWLFVFLIVYFLLIYLASRLIKNVSFYDSLNSIINSNLWLLTIIQLCVIVSSYWWFPFFTRIQAQKNNWSEEKTEKACEKKWLFMILLVVIAIIIRLI